VVTIQDAAKGLEKPLVRTKLVHGLYLAASGVAMVGWLCFLGWCAEKLLGF
jgi:hypothetical protein